jgi:hypothetical protein
MISTDAKEAILIKAQAWFRTSIAENHIKNTEKLSNPAEFNINPFLTHYLANFLAGNSSPENLSKALIYPRVLGTSITTSFGSNIQKFANTVLDSFGSTTSGIDIEFIDQIDNTRKYCQLKAGPNTINKDDVETLAGHFRGVINLGRTNNIRLTHEQLIVGVIYGEREELSSHYKRLESQFYHPVHPGKDFWHRLTGDPDFYSDLSMAIGQVAIESDYTKELEEVIQKLAKNLKI